MFVLSRRVAVTLTQMLNLPLTGTGLSLSSILTKKSKKTASYEVGSDSFLCPQKGDASAEFQSGSKKKFLESDRVVLIEGLLYCERVISYSSYTTSNSE